MFHLSDFFPLYNRSTSTEMCHTAVELDPVCFFLAQLYPKNAMSLLLHFDIEYLKGDTDHSFIEITVDENAIIYLNCIPVVINH